MNYRSPAPPDSDLVRRCLEGDQTAWKTLVDRYRWVVRWAACQFLGPGGALGQRGEVIESRVWSALLEKGRARLRAFDPGRGSLRAFLAAVARQEALRWRRKRQREQQRVLTLPPDQLPDTIALGEPDVQDFAATLTPRERECLEYIFSGKRDEPGPFSETAYWKMLERLRKKARRYVAPE